MGKSRLGEVLISPATNKEEVFYIDVHCFMNRHGEAELEGFEIFQQLGVSGSRIFFELHQFDEDDQKTINRYVERELDYFYEQISEEDVFSARNSWAYETMRD